MQSNYTHLKNIFEYVEEHIHEKLSLEMIAENIGLSKYYLHRISSAAIGRPLMEYIRARKLAHSLDMLIYTDLRILDIAKNFGFNHEQTYIKAFKKAFGTTPNKYRKGGLSIDVIERFDIDSLVKMGDNIMVKPRFCTKETIHLIGIKHYFTVKENKTKFRAAQVGNDFYFNDREKIKWPKQEEMYIGYSRLQENEPGPNLYMTALEVTKVEDVPEGMSQLDIPPHQYAVFKYIGSKHSKYMTYENVADILEGIFIWLGQSEYCQAAPFVFEAIDASIATETYCEIDIHIPVKRKV